MGSKVQAELGNAAGVSLTRPGHIVPPPPAVPRLRHCPWTRPPHHHGHPKVHFLFAPLLVWKVVLGFSSHEKSDGPGGRSDPRDNPPAFQRKPPKVISSLSFSNWQGVLVLHLQSESRNNERCFFPSPWAFAPKSLAHSVH